MKAAPDRPQCLYFRHTATRSLSIGHFSRDKPLIHRVIHRSCGTERNLCQTQGRDIKDMQSIRDLGPVPPSSLQSNCGDNFSSPGQSVCAVQPVGPLPDLFARQSLQPRQSLSSRLLHQPGSQAKEAVNDRWSSRNRRGWQYGGERIPDGGLCKREACLGGVSIYSASPVLGMTIFPVPSL